ncbi:MAG: TolC family protein [Candidatus Omnitrophota bacterium]
MKRTRGIIIIFFILSIYPVQGSAEEVLSWKDCIREAQKNHPDLISAQEQVNKSVADREVTKSGLFPQVTADLGATTTKSSTKSKTTRTYDYGVSGSQLVFDGSKTEQELKAASEDIGAAKETYRFTSSEVRLRLRSAFINLLKAQELLKVTQDIYEIRRGNLLLISLRYESGLEHKGAFLTAEANLAQAKLEIDRAKRDLEVAQSQLTKELGRSEFRPMRIEGDFIVKLNNSKPDFAAIASNNPSVKRLIFQKNSALYGVKSAYANFAPTITAQSGAGRTSSRWPPQNSQWDAGVSLSWPLFEGGLKSAQLEQARSLYKQYEADERSSRDTVVYALEEAWAGLQDAVESVGVEEMFLEATEERSNIAEAQYSLGLIQFDNWTIIEDDLVQSKKSLLNARANSLLAEANWIQAKGETLEYVD